MPRMSCRRTASNERGSVAVYVAIVLLALIGLTAIAVDEGQMWAAKAHTQDAADATAIALAAACATGDCGDVEQTADAYAKANGAESATVTVSANTVTVTANIRGIYLFGAVLGLPEGTIGATATASWAPLTSASTVPYALTRCAWDSQDGTDQTLSLAGDLTCPNGGFVYLAGDENCQLNVAAGGSVTTQPDSGCILDSLMDTTVLLPVVEQDAANSTTVAGIAAFHLTGWCTSGSFYNPDGWCGTDNQHLRGHVVDYIALQAGQTSAQATPFGVLGVRLD